MTTERTKYVRKYTFQVDRTHIEDYSGAKILHKATISGLSDVEQINAFAWFCISQGLKIHYKEYFKNASAQFEFFTEGKLTRQLIVSKGIVKYGQVWDSEGRETLINGSGRYHCKNREESEENLEVYKDSTLLDSYTIRSIQKDTIYNTFDAMAYPKEGFKNFYEHLANVIQYPSTARIDGAEGTVTVQFVVDKQGQLTDFKPLTNEGYGFENKVIKRLRKFPQWSPAILNKKPVKTRFSIPILFQITDWNSISKGNKPR